MFIDSLGLLGSSLQRSESLGNVFIHLQAPCAPLERQIFLGREAYRHLAPLEPEHRWVELRVTFSLEIDGKPAAKPERQAHNKRSPSASPPGSHSSKQRTRSSPIR